jgi:hypothetical protein
MTHGRFIGGAPFFAVGFRFADCSGRVWFLADTGASRSVLLDRDAGLLRVSGAALEPAKGMIVGIGGSVRSFVAPGSELTLISDEGYLVFHQEMYVVQHDLALLPPDEVARILKLPSILGRDILNRFRFTCDYQSGIVQLER